MFYSRRAALAAVAPLAAVLVATIIIPAGLFFVLSFFEFENLEIIRAFSLDNYVLAVTDQSYRDLMANTAKIAVPTTILAVCSGFALAYFIVQRQPRQRAVLIVLVVISMLASYLARTYAWRTLFGQEGMLSSILRSLGSESGAPDFLLFSRFSIVVAQVNFLLPFTTLVMFAGLVGISPQLRAVARDLGARPIIVFGRVTLPLAGPALLGAITLTFMLSAGDYLTPLILGGADSSTFGTAISDQLRLTGNRPLGSALSFVMIGAFIVVYIIVRVAMRGVGILPKRGGGAST
ncbi:ABC transporter permease [Actinobacteria bacterium YIM 96077]|uniref:ABC transmembrane type-1 domain-containing protein n=1 Tax=Phytoactinopolyspora halophila TaxID=1981511 RepID=A0A329QVS0_9ACTN|nr:ABC transporter permease [Phytoactinopolyspora halophila]AYY14945.1 ABC transporter permease [Actinobacteria bacterium YIM 96077]RAW15402.1 hypothetical protein DPM12_09125 [Phytoactinopolyspora halophila]